MLRWAVETEELSKNYPKQGGWRNQLRRSAGTEEYTPAVNGVNLQVAQGELFGLLGPNGAGKTTLIKMLSTLVSPTSGRARVNGYDLGRESEIKATIGLVTTDERSFYWRLSGRQNLEFFALLHGLEMEGVKQRLTALLEQVGLAEVADQRFQTYSTGMRQRLSIARALLNQPALLFLDEPTKGLDPEATRNLHDLIRYKLVGQQGITVLLTTHDLEEARQLCDRIAIMNRGRIQASGTLFELGREINLPDRYHLQVSGASAQTIASLKQQFTDLQVQPGDLNPVEDGRNAPGRLLVAFSTPNQGGQLNTAIDILRQSGASIDAVTSEKGSLEQIFSHHTRATGSEQQPATGNTERARRSILPDQDGEPNPAIKVYKPAPFSRIALAFLKRDLIQEASYRFSFVLQFLNILFTVGVFYYISELLGTTAAPYLTEFGGDYFSFVLIGVAFLGYFGTGLSSFASSLRQAQTTGTLEAMLTTPTSISSIILASSLWDYLLTTLRVLVFLAIGGLAMGVDLRGGNYLGASVVLILTIVVFSSIGIIAASFIMVLKRGDPITWGVNALSSFLGGVYFPVGVLPEWLQGISRLLPVTYALQAIRKALLQGATMTELAPDILALFLFSAVLFPASLLAFRYAVRRAKKDGSLTHY